MSIFGPINLLCWLYATLEALLTTVYTTAIAVRMSDEPRKHI